MASDERTNSFDGTCFLCGGILSRRGMSRHLKSCRAKQTSAAAAPPERIFHLLVEAKNGKDFYLHLEAPARLTLGDLDDFLRTIWLECCGHLSGFEFKEPRREGPPPPRPDMTDPRAFVAWLKQYNPRMYAAASDEPDQLFTERLGKRLAVGLEFEHKYDYGTTTTLCLKVLADEVTVPRGEGVFLLARNNPPEVACDKCGQPATQVASESEWEGWDALCDQCARRYRGRLLPLVNSPRAGICGYDGPATWENRPVVAPARPTGVPALPRKARR